MFRRVLPGEVLEIPVPAGAVGGTHEGDPIDDGVVGGGGGETVGIVQRLEFYSVEELEAIVRRSAEILQLPIEDEGALQIARRARGTPRVARGSVPSRP